MTRSIIMSKTGGPDVLKVKHVEVGVPIDNQIKIRQTFAGVNFHDCYVRSGSYKTLELPGTPGLEAVGTVEAIGPKVTKFKEGDRIGYVSRQYGGYSESRIIDENIPVLLPNTIDDRTAAATLLRGLTAQMLTHKVFPIQPEQTVLIHAVAGGVGRLLCQWAKYLGARVIGTVGNKEKGNIALKDGCDEVIYYREERFVDRVHDITEGSGVDVVYDSVGQDTFLDSIKCLAPRGHLANFGQSSGAIDPFSISLLFEKSNSVSRAAVFHYFQGENKLPMAETLFSALENGVIKSEDPHVYSFENAPLAHADLESRKTNGAVLLKI